MTGEHLMVKFHRALNSNTKPRVDYASGGSFMAHTFMNATMILDKLTKISIAWYTMVSGVASNTYVVGISIEHH